MENGYSRADIVSVTFVADMTRKEASDLIDYMHNGQWNSGEGWKPSPRRDPDAIPLKDPDDPFTEHP